MQYSVPSIIRTPSCTIFDHGQAKIVKKIKALSDINDKQTNG